MKCTNCDALIITADKFCGNCGAKCETIISDSHADSAKALSVDSVVRRLLKEFERQYGFSINSNEGSYERIIEQAKAGLKYLKHGKSYQIELPFQAVTNDNQTIHFSHRLEP